MLTLSVIGVEDGAIIAACADGERFRLPVDADLRARLQEEPPAAVGPRLSPREIQSHVRAGLSAQQVAALTGAPVAYIERFVGPVIAEREYITETARAVRLPPETEGARAKTFGAVMAERLAALAATGVRWTSTRETNGWIVALTFTADDDRPRRPLAVRSEAHAARPRRTSRRPRSRSRGRPPRSPRGCARSSRPCRSPSCRPRVPPTCPQPVAPPAPDTSRFDSAIFTFPDLRTPEERAAETPSPRRSNRSAPTRLIPEPVPDPRFGDAQDDDRASGEPDRRPRHTGPTTDQLASLSRRRGEREPSVDTASLPVTRAMSVIDTDDEDDDPFARRPTKERDTPAPVTRGPLPGAAAGGAGAAAARRARRRR